MQKTITGLLIIIAIIHLLPVTGVLGHQRLSELYGLSFQETNISILMRHRAVLFGLLGSFLIYAAFKPALQPLAFFAGFTSVVSFMAFAWLADDYNDAVRKVVIADIVALFCLSLGGVLYIIARYQR